MRIQHNIMAMNAYRNYNNNTSALSKNLEKLSSGYKINRAGDDAAGLAISEKMRAQITGLQAASKNVKDGVSLVKTAEGAMQEIHDMLNRMDYLANQSANGTYDNDVDRANLQKEVNSLRSEIDRIADSANFNGIKLLDGSLEDGATLGGVEKTPNLTSVVAHEAGVDNAVKPKFSISLDGYTGTFKTNDQNATFTVKVGDEEITFTATGTGKKAGEAVDVNAMTIQSKNGDGGAGSATKATINGVNYTMAYTGGVLTFTAEDNPTTDVGAKVDLPVTVATGAQFTADATAKYNPKTQVITAGVVKKPSTLASAEFTLSQDMVTDGGKLTIGDQTFTFDFKNDYVAGGTAIGVKDLLDANGKLTADAVKKLATRITNEAAANKVFTVGANGGTISLQEKTTNTGATAVDLSTAEKISEQVKFAAATTTGKALTLQIGDTSDGFNQLSVKVGDMHTKAMGTKGTATAPGKSIADISIANQTDAADAVNVIKDAINYVSSVRGDLGATQNRLEHTQNNLSVMTENIQDAESTIRDTDVADEMMAYTKNNILIQSAQAMLAQANQVPQGVLQLLQ